MTERKRRQNLAKCCSVSLQSCMDTKKKCSEVNVRIIFGKSLPIIALKCGTGLMYPEKLLSVYPSSKAD